jgi:hypothetical protein
LLTASEANGLAVELEKDARTEWARLNRFVRYARGHQKLPWLPDNAETEYRDLALKSASNWLELVIRAKSQGLYLDGYGDTDGDSRVWDEGWQANGMDARQHALNRATLTLGYSFQIIMPSDDGGVYWRPEAATDLHAVYADDSDEWPDAAIRRLSKNRYELYDDEARYTLIGKLGSAEVAVSPHGLGVTPVVRVFSQLDLLGKPMGEVEPVIPIQDRIVDATFTLQMVAKYGAFPQRWIAGMEVPEDAEGNPIPPAIKAYVDHIMLAADPDTKFGQFQAADLRQYVDALEAHIRHLAAITQTPPHYLLGSLVNLSAEALAAAEAGLQRNIREKREVMGEGYEQAFRLAALVLGDDDAAFDLGAQVHWQDVESRSLAQTADALLKLAQLGVPPRMLFRMIPGWTQRDADEAAALMDAGGGLADLMRELSAGQVSPEFAIG